MKKIKFFDYQLDTGNIKDYINQIIDSFKIKNQKNSTSVSFLNPHSFVEAEKCKIFKQSLIESEKLFIDGIGIKAFVKEKANRIIGYDFFFNLLKKLNENNSSIKIYFLGSTDKVLNQIKTRISSEFPKVNVCGIYQPSFVELEFSKSELNLMASDINKKNPDIVFVGLTAPKQEILSYELTKLVKGRCFINIGAVFDYYSKNKLMPIKIIRDVGLEWLFRLLTDFKKIKTRVFISSLIYIKLIFYRKIILPNKIENQNFKILTNTNQIKLIKNKPILVAFNLAFLGYYYKSVIKYDKNFLFWPDGITSKIFLKSLIKIPGHKLIDNLSYNNFNNILVIGNLEEKEKEYLSSKYKKKIKFIQLPFVSYRNLSTINLDNEVFEINDLVLITIPTPKQEILASILKKKYPELFIICLGGAISIASGRIPKCPEILDKLGLESIWRLQNDTFRRIRRISVSLYYASTFFIFNKIKSIGFEEIEKKN